MPVVPSAYLSPPGLRNGHVQTVLPLLLPRRRPSWRECERLELPDGDFVDLHWLRAGRERLAILSHGLEGCADAIYMRGMAGTLAVAGWDVLGWDFRGCGREENRLARSYHSGESGDLRAVISHAARGYDKVALIGFSLGGNITLKCVGEAEAHPAVVAAVAVSAPVDLTSSAMALDEREGNRIYLRRFLGTLIRKVERKAWRFPKEIAVEGIRQIRTIREFDDRFTAPLHGFQDAVDYWAKASALPHLGRIRVPSLLLNALNDPLLAEASFPQEIARESAVFHLEAPMEGGHVGFLDFAQKLQPWYERRVLEFLSLAERPPQDQGRG